MNLWEGIDDRIVADPSLLEMSLEELEVLYEKIMGEPVDWKKVEPEK